MRAAGALMVAAGIALAAFMSGFAFRDLANGHFPSGTSLGRLFGYVEMDRKTSTELFDEQYRRLLASSYRPVAASRLKFAAMDGMFASLGDPHTNFLEPVAAEDLKLETRGDFVGIGARLSPDPLGARVVAVFKGAPAEDAGLMPADTVIAVDGQLSAGTDVNGIVGRVRGKRGTTVRLKVIRPRSDKPIELTIRRDVVVLPTAEGRMIGSTGVGYIVVAQFAETTTDQFDTALNDIIAKNPKGLVIDLRSNPGGLLQTASEMLGRFLDDKLVVTMKRRGDARQAAMSPRGKTVNINGPIVVIVNEESASAAEIFAGVMQDYQNAEVIGEHSYGKSSVQQVFTLVDMASAKITTARYYLPSGRSIERKVDEDGQYVSGGLAPDIRVAPGDRETLVVGDPAKDAQLRAAVERVIARAKG